MAARLLLSVLLLCAGGRAAAELPRFRALSAEAAGNATSKLGALVASALLEGGVAGGARVHAVHANASELALLRNWARACRLARIPNLMLLALDSEAAAVGGLLGLPTLECARALPVPSRHSRCSRVSKLLAEAGETVAGGQRAALLPLLDAVLEQGHDVLLSEPDVARRPPSASALALTPPQVWLRDPELYLAVYDMLAADVLVASDCKWHFTARKTEAPRTRESREPLDSPLSLSLLLLRPSAHGRALLRAWRAAAAEAAAAKPGDRDGSATLAASLAALLLQCEGGECAPARDCAAKDGQCGKYSSLRVPALSPVPGGDWGVAYAQDLFPRYPPRVNDGTQAMPYRVARAAFPPDGLGLGLLPVGLFTSVHTFFVSDMPGAYRLQPYTLHAEAHGGAGGAAAGIARLREAALWADPPSYHAAPRLLHLQLDVPPRLLGDLAAKDEQSLLVAHTALQSWQLERVAEALVLTIALNRSLILPRMLCICDASQEGAACWAGELPAAPFPCAPGATLRDSDLDHILPSTFLSHPRFLELERPENETLTLRPCDAGAMSTRAGGGEALPPCFDSGGGGHFKAMLEMEGGVPAAQAVAAMAGGEGAWLMRLTLRGSTEVKGLPGGKAATEALNKRFAAAARYPVEPIATE